MSDAPISADNLPVGVSLGDLPDDLYPFNDPVWGVATGPDQYTMTNIKLHYHPDDAAGLTLLAPAPAPPQAQQFHLQGKHDQATHGKGGSPAQTAARQQANLNDYGDFRTFKDQAEMDAWGKEAFGATAASLSDAENEALFGYDPHSYQGGGAYPMNASMRQDVDPSELDQDQFYMEDAGVVSQNIGLVADVLSRSTCPENVVGHRGMIAPRGGELDQMLDSWQPGQRVYDKGFMSVSLGRDNPEQMFGGDRGEDGVMMEVRVPRGTNALYMQASQRSLPEFGDQAELLIQGGNLFGVLENTREPSGRRRIVVEMIPEGDL